MVGVLAVNDPVRHLRHPIFVIQLALQSLHPCAF